MTKAGHQPILTGVTNVQVHLDIMLGYQDHVAMPCQLHLFANKSQKAIAQELVNIFCTFGPQFILQVVEFSHAKS